MERNGASCSYGDICFEGPEFDVFLNFQKSDTWGGIADILYQDMVDARICVLTNWIELHRTKEIGDELQQGMSKCKIFMPIFSLDYATSIWCLKELAMMVDFAEAAAAEKAILPIFDNVDPLDVTLRTGLYHKALEEHKSKYGHEIVRKWEEALIKVGRMAGWSSKHFPREDKLRRVVVQHVLGRLRVRNRLLPKHLIGIEDQVDELMNLLNCGSPEIRHVVVHGVRGVGKTTLAGIIFNNISSSFDGCSFVSETRNYLSQGKRGILKLQKKMLYDILGTQPSSMFTDRKELVNVRDGISVMRRILNGRRLLIVLDDLDEKDQLTRLVGNCDWLGPTTRIIITTTNESLGNGLIVPGVVHTFEMKEITDDHAIHLFCKHAFGEDKPSDDCVMVSRQIVHNVGNLPLALEVIGSHLRGETKEEWDYILTTLEEAPGKRTRDLWERAFQPLEEAAHKRTKDLWEDTLQKFENMADKRSGEVLLISFRGLNDREKEVFLNIACSTSEVRKRNASGKWKNLYNKSAVLALARKSLIKILHGDELWMHDLIRELGGHISHYDSIQKLSTMFGRSRIVNEDAFNSKRRKVAPASGFRGMQDVSELTFEHCSTGSPGQPCHTSSEDMTVDKRPSTRHAAQTIPVLDNNWEVEVEGGDEESSEALARTMGEAQLATDELLIDGEHKVEAIVELMNVDRDGTGIIGICGSDGYGKTTLAKAVCCQVSPQFDAFCFLEDIIETMLLPHGIQSLQSKLMRDICREECSESASPPRRSEDFSESEHPHTRVLIVLDGIKDFSHIKELIGDWLSNRFGRGSRIIVTAAGNHLDVETLGGDWVMIYHISKMTEESTLRLFNHHAFGQDTSLQGYRWIAKTIVNGLKMCPLLIEVVGSLLRGRRSDEFKSMSKSIEPLTQGLLDTLRMSYYALDDVQKQIFLDIASFAGNEDARIAKYMWHDCLHEYPNQILLPHARVGKDNRLWMHSSVRHLAQEILLAVGSAIHSGMCSRVFVHQQAMSILINGQVKENVEALGLSFGDQQSKEVDSQNKKASMKLTAENFRKMPRLRYLALDSAAIVGNFNDCFTKLRWLRWQRCPKEFEATSVNMENLVILDVSGSLLTENWGGWKTIRMESLKVLNLSHCTGLLATPPLDAFPELERLILEGCSQLAHIDSTIGILKRLMFLNLKFCRGLRKLPEELGELEALRELLIDGTEVEEIPEINKLEKLEVLSSADCIMLGCIPDSIRGQKNLRVVTLRGCQRIQKLPDSMGGLGSSLVELDISGTGVVELPATISGLESLKILRMESCYITELPSTIGSLPKLEEIHASDCQTLKDVTEIGKLSQLRVLELQYASISSLPESITNLDKLEVLDLLHCNEIKKLPKLPSNLKLLRVNSELQPGLRP